MKNNWKEYSPRDHFWEKIMQKKDFESQLAQNLGKLPNHAPSELIWTQIEDRLDKRKKAFIWRPLLIAASLSGLFILAFYLVRQGTAYVDQVSDPSELLSEDLNVPPAIIPLRETPTEVAGEEEVTTKNTEKRKTERIPNDEAIWAPKNGQIPISNVPIRLPDLSPKTQEYASPGQAATTYHRVAISWGMKEKTKLRIGSGSRNWVDNPDPVTAQLKTKPTKNPLKFKLK